MSGAPDSAATSALVVEVPEAEPLVDRWRAVHDPSASAGVPAHVTILFPFAPPAALSPAALAGLAAAHAAFPARLARVEHREGVVWLAVDPEEPFRQLTAAAWGRFPAHPPYGGRFDDVVPHLTIGQGDHAAMAELAAMVERELGLLLPLTIRVEALALLVSDGRRWHRRASWPLRRETVA